MPQRFVQAMLVTGKSGDETAHRLDVFRVPSAERQTFFAWVQKKHPGLMCRFQSKGFTKIGTHGYLRRVADEFRRLYPETNVGWVVCPMKPGSVVFWTGPHRVTAARARKHCTAVRTVLYLQLLLEPSAVALPDVTSERYLDSSVGGKAVNRALEPAYARYVQQHRNQAHGWNNVTIPTEHHHCFVGNVRQDKPMAFLQRLRDHGMLTLDEAVSDHTAATLHATIVDIARTVYFDMPRRGMSADIRREALTLDDMSFGQQINATRFKRARYCRRNSTDLYCGYETADSQRMRCLMGVQGLTLSSQMLDVFAHPVFARTLIEAHPRLKQFIGLKHLYLGKERCSLRGPGAAELPPHTDDCFVDS